jgi:hypothetical protein
MGMKPAADSVTSHPPAWRIALLTALLLTSTGCANVTISPQGQPRIAMAPAFEQFVRADDVREAQSWSVWLIIAVITVLDAGGASSAAA